MAALPATITAAEKPSLPNIVYILADDMGYGDVACLNKDCRIPTPHMDRLAKEGMIFTDAHSGSAVCTPTRYGILTGRYCWRTRLKSGVLWGYSPALIEDGRMTVASLLKKHGYATACVGKWHLGLGRAEKTDYGKPLRPGPNDVGFDYFFGIPASLDMTPYCYIENDRPTQMPTDTIDASPSPAMWRGGPVSPDFKHEEVMDAFLEKTVAFIDRCAKRTPAKPFFVYMPLAAPHTPIVPTKPFLGKSGIGVYGDFVMQTDWTIGQVVDALERNELAENTLVIVTSDNGCSPEADYKALAAHGHNPSYIFRGHKADIFEGGHRIPFIARWPGRIKAASRCDETICLTDLMATAAEIVGDNLPADAGEDSVSMLGALLGKANGTPLREATVHHSINGSFSIRQGRWKLELCGGSGGWSYPRPEVAKKQNLPPVQLYDLSKDIGEKENVYAEHPDVVERLTSLLEKYKQQGHSRRDI
ncbi:MAG: arylsulfatase [Phycisphaerae bacterium]|nr:arylsulfatase [Phycisphaerae bacterium]